MNNLLFLTMACLLFASVLASRLSARLGMPLLLAFLGVGMIAGEEGLGIKFNNFALANFISQSALAVILLDGGLRTQFATFRIAIKPAVVLASWGVIASVGLLGVFATRLLGVDWKLGWLMAAIVGSTDAGAVFSLLRNSGVRLHPRIQATLELESGINDPMAILLVTLFIGMITQPENTTAWGTFIILIQQLGLGLVLGTLGGKFLAWLLTRVRLAEGMYSLMIMSGGMMLFALTNMAGGSGFLAVYLAGVLVGNTRNAATEHVFTVMDGLAWLAQATLFLVLGLLVTPSLLWEKAWVALAIAGFLILVARPLAVYSSIAWFKYHHKELIYISWVGLRGAVPVTLAIMPMMNHVPNARSLFDITFAVVILSLLIQGTTIPLVARKLGIVLPPQPEPLDKRELWLTDELSVTMQSFEVEEQSEAQGSHPYALTRAFNNCRMFTLVRKGRDLDVDLATQMQAGDIVWYVLAEQDSEAFARLFVNDTDNREEQQFFGEFVVNPQVKLGELAFAYGLKIDESMNNLPLGQVFQERFGTFAVAGDKINFDSVRVTVKAIDESGDITALGLKMPKPHATKV